VASLIEWSFDLEAAPRLVRVLAVVDEGLGESAWAPWPEPPPVPEGKG
jgi:hypothetical protein